MTGQTPTPNPAPTCAECGATTAPPSEAEPVTHCEWCGAEYPVPGSDEPPAPTAS